MGDYKCCTLKLDIKGRGMAKSTGCVTPLSFRTGIVRNPPGRDSHLSGHSPPCGVDPVQSMYGMTERGGSLAVKENCHGGTESRRREKAFPLCLRDSVAKAFMTGGEKPSP